MHLRFFRHWRHSLIPRTVLRIAVGAVLLMVLGSAAIYYLMFRAIEERGLIQLDQYVVERATREEANFLQIRDNIDLAARSFFERYHEPDPPGFLDRWDTLFVRDPDGAWRSLREAAPTGRDTTLWAHKDVDLTDELKRRTLILYDTHERFRPAWIDTFRSLWGCTPEMTNVGFDPLIAEWVFDTPADWAQNEAEWVAVATPERNPERRLVWTHSIIEEISGEYFVSACQPVYDGDRHLATFGHDLRVLRLIDRSVQAEIAGLTHMMADRTGRIIAHPDKRREILDTNGAYSMRDDPQLASVFAAISGGNSDHFAGYDPLSGLYYAVDTLEGPGWHFITTLPRAMLARDALRYARRTLWVGLALVAILLLFLAWVLRRDVAEPLAALTAATEQLSAGTPGTQIAMNRDDELGQLAGAFERMAQVVAERDASLRQLNADLENRIDERTRELQTSEARVRAMLENAPEAIVMVDADSGRFLTGNENAQRLFGVDPETLAQLGPADLSPPHQADGRSSGEAARGYVAAAATRQLVVFEWTHRNSNGDDVPCEIRLSRLPSRTRNLLVGTITDISERKQTEGRLRAALNHERELSAMKSGFVSMVSHEFRTPLGVISSSAEILSRYFARLDESERQAHLDTVVRSTRLLATMVEEVLLLGRFESDSMQLSLQPLDLGSFCERLTDEMLSATSHVCAIELTTRGDLANARCDETLLRHILSNLLTNAVKYSLPGSTVYFSVERIDDLAELRIRDTGIGIPTEDLPHLFTAFRRGRNVGQRTGTGLGLVIVKRCVELHRGGVAVESEYGHGTNVTVRLPVFADLVVASSERSFDPTTDENDSAY